MSQLIDHFIDRVRAECAGHPFDLRSREGDIISMRLTFVSRGKLIDDPTARRCDIAVLIEAVELASFDVAAATVADVAGKWKGDQWTPRN